MLNKIRASQDTGWCEEVKLLEILIQDIQPHLANQLSKWGKYIAKSDLRKIKKGSTHFIWNALNMMPEDELTKYLRFSQLLVWLRKDDVVYEDQSDVTAILQSLRTLQAEGLFKEEPCKPQR